MKSFVMVVISSLVALTIGIGIGFGSAVVLGTAVSQAQDCGVNTVRATDNNAVGDPLGGNQVVEANDDRVAILAAIQAVAQGDNRVVVSMLTGSYLESRWKRTASDGEAYGIYQIQMPGIVHPDVTIAEAQDIVFATEYMYPPYLAALRREEIVPLWASDPKAAAELTAYKAERPKYIYNQTQGQAMVDTAYAAATDLMRRNGISTEFGTAPNQTDTVQANVQSVIAQTSGSSCRNDGTTSAGSGAQLAAFSGATGDRQTVLDAANAQLGLPYVWGGGNADGPTGGGFDCSGLVTYALAQAGIDLPSYSTSQYELTRAFTVVPRGGDLAAAQPGDLVFFSGGLGTLTTPRHVGIYIGNGQMINAPQSGEDVKIVSITTSYWQNSFVAITDPFAYASQQTA